MTAWIDRDGPWLGDRRRRSEPEPQKAKTEAEDYAVPYLPAYCPKCNRDDKVTVTTTRRSEPPVTRYLHCHRCGHNFRSFQCKLGPNGTLVVT